MVESTPVGAARRTRRSTGNHPPFPGAGELTSTVPRQLVHRAAVAEVFLTDWSHVGDDRLRMRAQWPRAHSLYRPTLGHYDPMLAGETIRQAGVLAAHTRYEVPLGHRFLMRELRITVGPEHLAVGERPLDLDLDVTFTEVRGPGPRLAGGYHVTARHDGHAVATGGARFTCVSPAVYRRIRAARPTPPATRPAPAARPLPAASVGRASDADVVLAAGGTPGRWLLRVDTGHPVLFDHPDDHVPGMVLLEAARQAALAVSPGTAVLPVSMDSVFHRYVEFDSPCWITVDLPDSRGGHPPDGIRVVALQNDERVYVCELTLTDLSAGPAEEDVCNR
ncbi:ScbA/BarX family gamma-butyrolactone biosynthesis protein [Streptomyces sp. NRRL F-5135]|uniref:ScbA/BarX family gamma-butyrolactone biosynthesis protein n=1 Tax=Streptomyces sp. NRRL F-5135 TaxID=1463858 RepID=UPI00099CE21A|nr:ScbA/BarX family gamma-butyrolactone biosynthesis protein [Streptomyces sp. NRRL F-5135]